MTLPEDLLKSASETENPSRQAQVTQNTDADIDTALLGGQIYNYIVG